MSCTTTAREPGWPSAVRAAIVILALLLALAGCGYGPVKADVRPGAQTVAAQVIRPGLGVFTFDGYPPLSERPVRVFYAAPANPATAQILVVLHGVRRNAQEYRADWERLAQQRNVLVLAPEFAEDEYPGSSAYSLGNMVDSDDDLRPPRQWSFQVVEALFDFVVRDVGSSAQDYAMFGHSAGAQFVHRFVEFMPRHRARVAVAANAGWYTMPDDSAPFPYGLGGSPASTGDLGPAFASKLVVLIGGDDTDQDDDNLRRDEQSDRQGLSRRQRGLSFFRLSEQVAAARSFPFAWRLHVIRGVAHDHSAMAAAAVPLLLNDL